MQFFQGNTARELPSTGKGTMAKSLLGGSFMMRVATVWLKFRIWIQILGFRLKRLGSCQGERCKLYGSALPVSGFEGRVSVSGYRVYSFASPKP